MSFPYETVSTLCKLIASLIFKIPFPSTGDFASAPATDKEIHWDEIGIFKFNEDDKLVDMWYMIDELRIAQELGHTLK